MQELPNSVALIDKFAMAALPAVVSENSGNTAVYIANKSYEIAEAMMERRLKRTESRYGKKRT